MVAATAPDPSCLNVCCAVQVDVHSDVLAAWLSKLMPLVDSVILLQVPAACLTAHRPSALD